MSAHPPSTPTPDLVVLRSRAGAALIAATVLASASCSLDAGASQVAIPAIGRSLHAGLAGVTARAPDHGRASPVNQAPVA